MSRAAVGINNKRQQDLPYGATFEPRIDDYSLRSGTTIENLMRQFGICIKQNDENSFGLNFINSDEPVTFVSSCAKPFGIEILTREEVANSPSALKAQFARECSDKILLVPTAHPDRPRMVHLGRVVSEDSDHNGQ
jgi:hypothetical protein